MKFKYLSTFCLCVFILVNSATKKVQILHGTRKDRINFYVLLSLSPKVQAKAKLKYQRGSINWAHFQMFIEAVQWLARKSSPLRKWDSFCLDIFCVINYIISNHMKCVKWKTFNIGVAFWVKSEEKKKPTTTYTQQMVKTKCFVCSQMLFIIEMIKKERKE